MNKNVYRQDIFAGMIIILAGIAAFALAAVMPGKASMFPKIVSSCLMVLGMLLIADSALKIKKDTPTEEQAIALRELKSPAIVLLMLVAYVLAVIYIGFYISTPIMLICYMFLMGIRNIKTIIIATVVVMAFVYCLFTMQLGVPLPAGILG